jgi:hypothetical protein
MPGPPVAALDVDIILDDAPSGITLMDEQSALLVQLSSSTPTTNCRCRPPDPGRPESAQKTGVVAGGLVGRAGAAGPADGGGGAGRGGGEGGGDAQGERGGAEFGGGEVNTIMVTWLSEAVEHARNLLVVNLINPAFFLPSIVIYVSAELRVMLALRNLARQPVVLS